MRLFIFLAALFLSLASCATAPYGNFAAAPAAYDQKMAADTVRQLTALYPPAHTRFAIKQPAKDAYGLSLIEALRVHGYALFEPGEGRSSQPMSTSMDNNPSSGLDLHYAVDKQSDINLYRVTVTVGQQSLSRAYIAQNDTVYPAGSWVRKE
ncbi:MAG TPA: conjugal transfer protein TrbH [Candidatus Competibacteraceae bacterium]|nr:conjugal transfer protein TrbH [Candidatus Competibacteraceae bacterium]